jgi:hypothetical protein
MGTKLLLVGIVVMSTVTAASGYAVGTGNGAFYFFGGPPSSNSNYASVGSTSNGAYANQHASAYVPWGVGVVGQAAGAVGGQFWAPGVLAQGTVAGMSQTAAKVGGGGAVVGTQTAGIGMSQSSWSGNATQGMYATGMQYSGQYGGLGGASSSSQTMVVSTGQILVH